MGGLNSCQKVKLKNSSDDQPPVREHAAGGTHTETIDGLDKAHQVFDNTPTTYPAGAARAVFNSLMDKERGDKVAAANSKPANNSTQPNNIYPDDAYNYQYKQAAAGPTFVNRGNIGAQNNTTGDYNRVDARVTGPVTFSNPTPDE